MPSTSSSTLSSGDKVLGALIFEHTEGIGGFFGASSIERLATEPAIESQARKFTELSLK